MSDDPTTKRVRFRRARVLALAVLLLTSLMLAGWLGSAYHRCHVALARLPTPSRPSSSPADPAAMRAWEGCAEQIRSGVAGGDGLGVLESDPAVRDWLAGVDGATPARVDVWLRRRGAALDALHQVLAMPGLHIDVPPLPTSGMPPAYEAIPNLLDLRAAAEALRVAARVATDPGPSLGDLDRLLAMVRPPNSLVAACIGEVVADERDQAYLAAAVSGSLDDDVRARWLAEQPFQLADLAYACAMHLSYWVPASAASDVELGPLEYRRQHLFSVVNGKPLDWVQAVDEWAGIPDRAAIEVEWTTKAMSRFAGQGGQLPLSDPFAFPYAPAGPLVAMGDAAVRSETQHRLARVAAAVVAIHDARGDLPADLVQAFGLAPAQAALGLDRPALAFERLDEDRFRISLVLTSPLPEFMVHPAAPPEQGVLGLHRTWVEVRHAVIGPGLPQANQ